MIKKYGAFRMPPGQRLGTLRAALAEIAHELGDDAKIDDLSVTKEPGGGLELGIVVEVGDSWQPNP